MTSSCFSQLHRDPFISSENTGSPWLAVSKQIPPHWPWLNIAQSKAVLMTCLDPTQRTAALLAGGRTNG